VLHAARLTVLRRNRDTRAVWNVFRHVCTTNKGSWFFTEK
jgi:hypothetical protein